MDTEMENEEKSGNRLTSGSIAGSVLRFSLPYLLAYFLQTLYGMADLFIIGQFGAVFSAIFRSAFGIEAVVGGLVGQGVKMGEGWLLPAEMVELISEGVTNIVCTQPFGCLPNHIAGKGMIRKIREVYPQANIVAVDYDPGASKINQENRIKLMLSSAE